MTLKFDQLLEVNNQKLNKQYIQSLSKQERLDLIDPIFNLLRENGWIYPDNTAKLNKSWKALLDFVPDLNSADLFNNSSLATDICKFFCHTFYLATERDKPTLIDNFNNDAILKKIIHNRLGLAWLDADDKGGGVNEAFNLSFKMVAIQGQRSMRLVNATSMFKPSIAKYMALKYSSENDTIFDYSCGFAGRLMGTMAANRKYIGTDPLTTPELTKLAEYFKFDPERYKLINSGSEKYRGEENSVDLCYSSPPYIEQEFYSNDPTQAYNNGEDYFYDTYWQGTLENAKYMLKPGKIFGLNILEKYSKMVQMTTQQFGEPIEIIKLRTVRSHLTKNRGADGGMAAEKFEPIYIFRNNK
jgi:hypothetical protein